MNADKGLVLGGRYEVIAPLDSGTLADIRLAFDTRLQRKVAVKLAVEVEKGEEEQFERGQYRAGVFKREAEMAASMQHPHLHPVYDYGVDGEHHYLVMRFFNETLRKHLRRYAPPNLMKLDVAVALFEKIAGAIDYMHEHGSVVHGNLKPNNILLDTESGSEVHPFVSDFGVAALGARLIGTPLYMAPEQMTGGTVTLRADLFALGVIVYECLTCSLPFPHGELSTMCFSKLQPKDGQYSVRKARPELPVAVDLVVEGLTRADPAERFPSASRAIKELARALYTDQAGIEGTVFLSYAREESAYVHDLARRLRSVGVKIWVDTDIQPGASWDRSIEEALKSTSSMLVIASRASVESEAVRDEWGYFLDHGKAVYPVIYEACELPLRLRRRQYIEIERDMLIDVARIVAALARPGRIAESKTDL